MRKSDFRILLIEASSDDADFLMEVLSAHTRERYVVDHAVTLNAAIHQLSLHIYDVVLLDLQLPDSSGQRSIRKLKEQQTSLPIIVLSDNDDLDLARKLLERGVQECLIKGQISRSQLMVSIHSAVQRQKIKEQLFNEKGLLESLVIERNRELGRSESKLEKICNSTQDTIVLIDQDERIVFCNTSGEDLLGYSFAEIQEKTFRSLLAPHQRKSEALEIISSTKSIDTIPQSQRLIELCLTHKNGTECPVELSLAQLDLGGDTFIIGVARDISQRIRAESELTKSQEAFHAIVNNSRDGLIVVDDLGCVLFANPSALRMFQTTVDVFVGELFGFPVIQNSETEIELVGREKQTTLSMATEETTWDNKMAFVISLRDITVQKEHAKQRERDIEALQKAIKEIKTLQGILPICMHCKKIRDDKGAWERIEEYISERSDVDFSHGICEDCLEKHYPDD